MNPSIFQKDYHAISIFSEVNHFARLESKTRGVASAESRLLREAIVVKDFPQLRSSCE
jgi:hypothetical protein